MRMRRPTRHEPSFSVLTRRRIVSGLHRNISAASSTVKSWGVSMPTEYHRSLLLQRRRAGGLRVRATHGGLPADPSSVYLADDTQVYRNLAALGELHRQRLHARAGRTRERAGRPGLALFARRPGRTPRADRTARSGRTCWASLARRASRAGAADRAGWPHAAVRTRGASRARRPDRACRTVHTRGTRSARGYVRCCAVFARRSLRPARAGRTGR